MPGNQPFYFYFWFSNTTAVKNKNKVKLNKQLQLRGNSNNFWVSNDVKSDSASKEKLTFCSFSPRRSLLHQPWLQVVRLWSLRIRSSSTSCTERRTFARRSIYSALLPRGREVRNTAQVSAIIINASRFVCSFYGLLSQIATLRNCVVYCVKFTRCVYFHKGSFCLFVLFFK